MKTWKVQIQINHKNEMVWIEVKANNMQEACIKAKNIQRGVVCDAKVIA